MCGAQDCYFFTCIICDSLCRAYKTVIIFLLVTVTNCARCIRLAFWPMPSVTAFAGKDYYLLSVPPVTTCERSLRPLTLYLCQPVAGARLFYSFTCHSDNLCQVHKIVISLPVPSVRARAGYVRLFLHFKLCHLWQLVPGVRDFCYILTCHRDSQCQVYKTVTSLPVPSVTACAGSTRLLLYFYLSQWQPVPGV